MGRLMARPLFRRTDDPTAPEPSTPEPGALSSVVTPTRLVARHSA
ncbi:hypothetical protein ACFZCL_25275 [Streptomyces sp. NPDC008159]